jgi:hypothetical protein
MTVTTASSAVPISLFYGWSGGRRDPSGSGPWTVADRKIRLVTGWQIQLRCVSWRRAMKFSLKHLYYQFEGLCLPNS